MIAKAPWLLSCKSSKRVLPKFQFFLLKGATYSNILKHVSKNPTAILKASLKNQLVPTYELVYRFLQSNGHFCFVESQIPTFFWKNSVVHNIRVLIESGVTNSNIARLLWSPIKVLYATDLPELVEEFKDSEFDPSQSTFSIALIAKTYLSKTWWKEKYDAFKK